MNNKSATSAVEVIGETTWQRVNCAAIAKRRNRSNRKRYPLLQRICPGRRPRRPLPAHQRRRNNSHLRAQPRSASPDLSVRRTPACTGVIRVGQRGWPKKSRRISSLLLDWSHNARGVPHAKSDRRTRAVFSGGAACVHAHCAGVCHAGDPLFGLPTIVAIASDTPSASSRAGAFRLVR
jgi:hypothetical protein